MEESPCDPDTTTIVIRPTPRPAHPAIASSTPEHPTNNGERPDEDKTKDEGPCVIAYRVHTRPPCPLNELLTASQRGVPRFFVSIF